MNMNIQKLMAEAQKLEKELNNVTNEIESTVFEGVSGPVKVTGNGKYEITKIECSDDDLVKEKDEFLDTLQIAVNDMLNKVKDIKKQKLSKYNGGIGNLF